MSKEIQIRCKGSRLVAIGDIKPFQGNLKEVTKDSIEKLKVIIVKRGWTAPMFLWRDSILDGHGRLLALKSLIEEGYTMPQIPVIDIEAKDEREAGAILLELNSRHNRMTDEGLYEFINTFKLQDYDFDNLELPDININQFMEGYLIDDTTITDEGSTSSESVSSSDDNGRPIHKCPECNHEWQEGNN